MAAKLISTGGSGLNEYLKKLTGLSRHPVSVGVHKSAGKHEGSDLTVAQVAAYNEFGTERIPERAAIRTSMRENKVENLLMIARIIKKISSGKGGNHRQAMGKVGMKVQNDIQRKIVELKTPPNAQSTIDRKKSSNPLVDTGQLVNSIRWEYANND
ncbi:neck protein [Vibrio phage 1.123.O._10N.286.48.F3]|nr:neck protein [Vibrio phage 1.123.O._10N.286.48.F3]